MRPLLRLARIQWQIFRHEPLALISAVMVIGFVVVAIFGPAFAPHDPEEMLRSGSGELLYLSPPSSKHWLGTTNVGGDVFSQLLVGARVAVSVGFFAALLVTVVGTLVGLIAGYYRGWVDDLLMRLVDVAYSIPFEPLAIVLLALVSRSFWSVVLAVSLLSWRAPARVIRTQVLTMVERPFVKAARVSGASNWRIMLKYLAPNVLPISFVYVATTFGNAVLAEATVSFLGFGDPDNISWGAIMQLAYSAGAVRTAWWWILPPGICISVLVASIYFLTRAYDEVLNPRLRGQT